MYKKHERFNGHLTSFLKTDSSRRHSSMSFVIFFNWSCCFSTRSSLFNLQRTEKSLSVDHNFTEFMPLYFLPVHKEFCFTKKCFLCIKLTRILHVIVLDLCVATSVKLVRRLSEVSNPFSIPNTLIINFKQLRIEGKYSLYKVVTS